MFEFIERLIAELALSSANIASGTASLWLGYQPKEPKSIKKDK